MATLAVDLSEKSCSKIIKGQIFMFNGVLAFHADLNALDSKSHPRYTQVLHQGCWTAWVEAFRLKRKLDVGVVSVSRVIWGDRILKLVLYPEDEAQPQPLARCPSLGAMSFTSRADRVPISRQLGLKF